MEELERIKKAYAKRDLSGKSRLYDIFNPSALYIHQQREKAILITLSKFDCHLLSNITIFDTGCGTGDILRDFVKYGAMPENCYGIDLLPGRIETAKRLSPNMHFTCGNAETLPYEKSFFDVILCFTVFTSIFDRHMKQHIANEMLRVLEPEGIILWYDYFLNNPRNPDVRGVKKQEIHTLFNSCEIMLKRTTLAPPLTRMIAPFSTIMCELLEKIPVLCTHYLGVIRKKSL